MNETKVVHIHVETVRNIFLLFPLPTTENVVSSDSLSSIVRVTQVFCSVQMYRIFA